MVKKKRSLLKRIIILGIYFFVAAVGSGVAVFISQIQELPNVRNLEHYKPTLPAQVFDKDKTLIHEFAAEKRELVTFQDIPKQLQDAIIAAEDAHFWEHTGVYPLAIIRAFISNIRAGTVVQGGSTITQQLATLLFLKRERTYKRKIKEALLAIQIEHSYSKEEILTLYCNQVFYGHGTYGIKAAASFYFNKELKDLTLEEAAMLAAIPKKAQEYSPVLHPKEARDRRDYVLMRMAEEKLIPEKLAKEAIAKPIKLATKPQDKDFSAYFIEEVRKYIEQKYGYEGLYANGLKIYTTLDTHMQQIAESALRKGLHNLAKIHGWNDHLAHIDYKEISELSSVTFKEWEGTIKENSYVPALIVNVAPNKVDARISHYSCILTPEKWTWTYTKSAAKLLKVGDVALVRIEKIDDDKNAITASLEQMPEIEGSFLAMEIGTGKIKAMMGGYNFSKTKFNRATQALRQPGSSFKPFVFATAFEKGFTPADIIEDAPITFIDPVTHQVWSPGNYTGDFLGFITLRRALELSRNTTSVRLLNKIGVKNLIDLAKRAGIQSTIQPFLSSALGASDVTLMEMVAGYSVFANQGIFVRPYIIEKVLDSENNVVEEHYPFLAEAMNADIAFLVNYVLEGVIQRGTAYKAKSLGGVLAGKTGTTDDFTDAWFIGYSPSLIAGVWVGYDEKKSIGRNYTGAKAALPIWMDFMQQMPKDTGHPDFVVPSNIIFMPVDRFTGLRASPGCSSVILEAFIKGTEPKEYCSGSIHSQVSTKEPATESREKIPDER